MLMKVISLSLLLLLQVAGADNLILTAPDTMTPVPWNISALYQPPKIFPASEFTAGEPGIRALFYQGEDYHGRETRVFAWIGIPTNGAGPFPGMVLVHGGGGTAYKEWVKLWMDRGYAAIAMDTAGQIPVHPEGATKGWAFHEYSGPRGWGGFDQIDDPVKDQWSYHAVAAVINGHSLLCSFPQVDASRIGITGISWGGYLTCIAAGLDNRFSLAVPVYGCGFLGEASYWVSTFLNPDRTDGRGEKWLALWDPRHYITSAKMPMLFVTGTNDKYYWMASWQKTYRQAQGNVTLCCKVKMAHNHAAGWSNEEIYTFADSILKNGTPLPEITDQGRDALNVWVKFKSNIPVEKAELNYTADAGESDDRVWNSKALSVDVSSGKAAGLLPGNATAYYVNLINVRGLISSSQYEKISTRQGE